MREELSLSSASVSPSPSHSTGPKSRPVALELVEHPRLDPWKDLGLEAGTEAFRVRCQLLAWDDEVPHRLAGLVQNHEDVDVIGFNPAVRNGDEVPRAKRLDLDCEGVARPGVVGEQVNGLGIAEGHRCLNASLQQLSGHEELASQT